ncbi:hypothetical protein E0Z10_g3880 [Xylaria hypoxylon]|uniref:Heterokaryon incompatibility domain-containing protein n=1 Tax=Xylaria hypoxylon TaxID=37992 RepID=A0A4Z0YM07_9PEZI|nr:hypothetical protein E0Z10_g3880 [Xylaria hypoxylon]
MNLRQCTICEAKDAGHAPRVNPRLCGGCQDWDDLLHVNYCRERAETHAPLNPVPFCYKHNPNWPPSRKGNYSELKTLEFFSREHFAVRRQCIMCSAVGDALERAISESEDGQETKIAVWRPFIFDTGKHQWNVRDEQTAMEKGMVPWLQKCVLAICIATAPIGEDSWSYQPRIMEFILRYEKWCYDLSHIGPWDRQVMDTSQIEVVADAIHLCVEIGQRYLWVDRFCIVQDDLELKAEQIEAMGVIYDRAFLTIVALGDGPTPGLVGLNCRPRQQGFQNWSWDLLPTMSNPVGEARVPLINMALSESIWNQRAWTFQEMALSKRKIYFDAGQVYGGCTKERWQEKPEDENEGEWMESQAWEIHKLNDHLWDFNQDSFAVYSGIITRFSPRKLTFPNDILPAFAGVVNVLETQLKRPILLGHPEEFFTKSLSWVPQPGFMATRRVLDCVPSWSWAAWDSKATWDDDWTIAPGIYLAARVSVLQASFVNFYFSDPKQGLRPVKEQHQPLEHYLVEQKRAALKVIKEAADSWWPSSISSDPVAVEVGELDELIKLVWDWAYHKAQDDDGAWPPSTFRTPPKARLHDISEVETAYAALRNLDHAIDTRWWPPTVAKDLETHRQLENLSTEAKALAEERPNSIIFNTTCAYLKVGSFGQMWFKIPPRRNLSGCAIQNQEGIPVGITMAMAPQLTFDMFRKGGEYLVALLGVCSAKRWMQWDKGERSRLPPYHLNELCLLVIIMDENDGVCQRLAVGVVYADEWMNLQPQWRTVVLA